MLGLQGVRKMRLVACLVGFLMISHLGMASLDEETDLENDLLGDASSVVSGSLEDEFDVQYDTPVPIGPVYFAETFDDPEAAKKTWIMSKAQKEDQENVFKYEGKWEFEHPQKRLFPNDQALVMKSKAKHHAISAFLEKPFEFRDKPLIMQYEVTFQNGMDCGGAYVKLLSSVKGMKLEQVHDKTPFTIMFGPDKCGSDVKIHFIFRHKNPINGTFSEKHSKRPSNRVEETYTDKKPHLYKLKLTPENKFEVFVDERLINQGNLLEDFTPPVNPPMEIEDPNDFKPTDWDEREKIPDPTAEKPSDWDDEAALKIPDPNAVKPSGWLEDEEEMVPDPKAVKPEDWDESMDGSWEPPLINNPKCQDAAGCGPWVAPLVDNPNFKGKWRAPLIANPNYKGKWSKRMIPNPDYFEDKEPFKMSPIGAVGLELWTMSDNVLFDNFIISDDDAVVEDWTSKTWELKRRIFDRDSEGVIRRLINYSNAHPWLWAIYVFVIGLPLVLIFTYCCGSSQDKKLTDAKHKKTDEISADDLLGDVDQLPGKGKDVHAKSSTNSAISKEDLEEPENEDVEESEEDNAEVEEEEEEEEEESEPEPEPVVEQKSGKGARQRKTRRD